EGGPAVGLDRGQAAAPVPVVGQVAHGGDPGRGRRGGDGGGTRPGVAGGDGDVDSRRSGVEEGAGLEVLPRGGVGRADRVVEYVDVVEDRLLDRGEHHGLVAAGGRVVADVVGDDVGV